MGDFKGVTFSAQNVTPKDDGALYNAHYGDGILDGCAMAISGDDLVIQPGYFIACGRVCHVDGATSVDLSGRTYQTGFIQVIMNYDLTQGEGQQWYTSFLENTTAVFSDLTQDDINDNGTLYQVELAVVQISGGSLSLYSSMNKSGLVIGGNILIKRTGTNDARFNVSASGEVINLGKYVSGSSVGGVNIDSTNSAIIYGSNGVYIRPNGQGDPSGQMTVNTDGSVTANGQITGGHPNTPRTPSGGATLTASMSTITSVSAGIVSAGVYLVTAECDYQPTASSAVSHYPQFEIQNSIKNTYYTGTLGARHYCISGIVTGVSSVVFRGTTGTGSTNATVSNIVMNVVRLS